MSSVIGRQAIVVGAGIGGLTAARTLADHFERVLVLERDALPEHPDARTGTPQANHVHALLAGGQHALGDLFAGFENDLAGTGEVALRAGLDIRTERPGYDPFPQRDLGFVAYAISRPQLELTVRQRVRACGNIEFHERCRVENVIARDDGSAITGVRCTMSSGAKETLPADLVVDASGRGTLTLGVLESIGAPLPEATTIGVDLGYATAVFQIPEDAPRDWKGVFSFGQAPRSSRGALLLPIEGNRWIITIAGRHDEKPPGDPDGFMAFAQRLRTPTIYNAIKDAKRIGDIHRYRFTESVYRRYDRLGAFPRGLLPVGDAVCRFNPVYGQGMSVAAQEACALGRLLASRAGERDPLDGLAAAFVAEADRLIDTPWATAAIPDFAFPQTRGERPENLQQIFKFAFALNRLAAEDPAVHKLIAEVAHLLKPRSVYQDPELVQRVLALLPGS